MLLRITHQVGRVPHHSVFFSKTLFLSAISRLLLPFLCTMRPDILSSDPHLSLLPIGRKLGERGTRGLARMLATTSTPNGGLRRCGG